MARGRSLFRRAPAAGLGTSEARQVIIPQRLPRTTIPLGFIAPLRRYWYAWELRHWYDVVMGVDENDEEEAP